MQEVLDYLGSIKIEFEKFDHKPVFTVDESTEIDHLLRGTKTKNLFLRDKKKRNFFLVSTVASKAVDLKKLTKTLGVDRLSFGKPEYLEKYLHVEPGSVSPFGLLFDKEKIVRPVMDMDLFKDEFVNFHPNTNNATLTLTSENFKKFLQSLDREIIYLKIE